MPATVVIPRQVILALALACGLLLAGIAAVIYLPSATIRVSPQTAVRTVEQTITLSAEATEPDFVQNVLPANVTEVTVDERREFTRADAETFEDFARGEVVLTNNQAEPQALLPQTHLRHEASGVFFLTDSPVTIPPEGEVKMRVTAKEKGAAGNVPPGRFIVDKLPTSLQQVVYAESSAAFTGGLAIATPLSEEEINRAKEEIIAAARERALGELTARLGGAAVSDELLSVEVQDESVSAEPGSQAKDFAVAVTIRARAMAVDENDILSLTLLTLRGSVEPEEDFVSYDPASFTLELIRSDFARGQAQVKGNLAGTFATKIGPSVLDTSRLAGLNEAEIQAHFANVPAVSSATVDFSPFWVATVPARAGATEVLISGTAAQNTPAGN